MSKVQAIEFVKWAVGHATKKGMPQGTIYGDVGTDVWQYLFGSHGQVCTQAMLDHAYKTHYAKNHWTREQFDYYTRGWVLDHQVVTDCEGLYDAYAGIDVNADYNYRAFCTDKGEVGKIDRPWVVGEAVFMGSATKKTHIGWVCGFTSKGVPLVVEARGLAYGVVITSMATRVWDYRGLMTKRFDYTESPVQPGELPYIFTRNLKYGMKGADVIELKKLLIKHGYTSGITVDTPSSETFGASTKKMVKAFQSDAGLTIDGIAGRRTIRALGGRFD